MGFDHLHTHSHYSLLEGVAAPEALAGRAAQFGMPALALTDHAGLYGAVPFYQACQTAGVQPILGLEEALGFAPYFLIVADLVAWCRRQGIPVLGRGSAADSLVAYCLGITQVDPLAHGLFFERFLNAERPEPPDIDLDLCWRRRDQVLNYVYERDGRDHVAMIGTHVRFHLRSAWRDVAKAHGLAEEEFGALAARPYGYGLEEAQADAEAGGGTRPP